MIKSSNSLTIQRKIIAVISKTPNYDRWVGKTDQVWNKKHTRIF